MPEVNDGRVIPLSSPKQFFDSVIGGSRGYVAIHDVHYNFARIHKTLRITPAVSADLNDHIWSLEEIVIIADSAPAQKQRGPYNKEGRSMKRSFGKRAALVFWAVGSCGAVLFSCGLTF